MQKIMTSQIKDLITRQMQIQNEEILKVKDAPRTMVIGFQQNLKA